MAHHGLHTHLVICSREQIGANEACPAALLPWLLLCACMVVSRCTYSLCTVRRQEVLHILRGDGSGVQQLWVPF